MKRITRLSLRNFKAFRDQEFDFGGKNVLIYGNNGSGKSSLYWALYTILQSTTKSSEAEVRRYFQPFDPADPTTYGSLKNIFADETAEAHIRLTWRDGDTGPETTVTISNTVVNTLGHTTLAEANLASDFITHRLLQNFYNASHKQETNLWDVFMRDVFPYFLEDEDSNSSNNENVAKTYRQLVEELLMDLPRVYGGRIAREGDYARLGYNRKIEHINSLISQFLGSIETTANNLLAEHFYKSPDVLKIHLDYDFRQSTGTSGYKIEYADLRRLITAYTDVNERLQNAPWRIKLWVEIYDKQQSKWVPNHRPHSFLNEAQLTRIAFAVRIGALRTRLQTSDFKLLCLDDMLISLDMSNRHQVLDLLLTSYDVNYQLIMLTHDRAFFEKTKRQISTHEKSGKWTYLEMYEDIRVDSPRPFVKQSDSNIACAEQHLVQFDFPAAANYLRKACEELLSELLPIHYRLGNDGERVWKLDVLLVKAEEYYKSLPLPTNPILDIREYLKTLLNPLSHADLESVIYRQELEAVFKAYQDLASYKQLQRISIVNEHEQLTFTLIDQANQDELSWKLTFSKPLDVLRLPDCSDCLGLGQFDAVWFKNGQQQQNPINGQTDLTAFYKDACRKTGNEPASVFEAVLLPNGQPIRVKL